MWQVGPANRNSLDSEVTPHIILSKMRRKLIFNLNNKGEDSSPFLAHAYWDFSVSNCSDPYLGWSHLHLLSTLRVGAGGGCDYNVHIWENPTCMLCRRRPFCWNNSQNTIHWAPCIQVSNSGKQLFKKQWCGITTVKEQRRFGEMRRKARTPAVHAGEWTPAVHAGECCCWLRWVLRNFWIRHTESCSPEGGDEAEVMQAGNVFLFLWSGPLFSCPSQESLMQTES